MSPWSASRSLLHGRRPAGGQPDRWPALGVCFGFNIDQDGGERDGQLMWSGFFYNWIDTTRFGTLRLDDDCLTTAERFEE